MTGKQCIAEYVDAVRAWDALARQDAADISGFTVALRAAAKRVAQAERTLTGGQLGEARRRLAAGSGA